MSYDLTFDCGELDGSHDICGGTYALGGTTEPSLNITYNYSKFFAERFGPDGIRNLYGLSAAQVVEKLDQVIPTMRGTPSSSYWDATEGNAKAALVNLRNLAALCPADAILEGD